MKASLSVFHSLPCLSRVLPSGMAARPESLAERRRRVEEELVAARRALKREKVRVAGSRRAAARAWVLSGRILNTTLTIYLQAQYEVQPAIKYLTGVARQRHWPSKPEEEVGALVEDAFLRMADSDAGLEELAGLGDVNNPTDVVAMRDALKFVEEWKVVEWARQQHAQRRLAPSTSLLLEYAEASRAKLPASARQDLRGSGTDGGRRKWAFRLRQRWGGRLGKFKVREELPLVDARHKARSPWTTARGHPG